MICGWTLAVRGPQGRGLVCLEGLTFCSGGLVMKDIAIFINLIHKLPILMTLKLDIEFRAAATREAMSGAFLSIIG